MISDIHTYNMHKNTLTDICTLVNIEAHTLTHIPKCTHCLHD